MTARGFGAATLATLLFALPASAGTATEFSFTAPGGTIANDLVNVFSLEMEGLDPDVEIAFLELALGGLYHDTPADLDLYLVDPHGATLAVMLDRGDGNALIDVSIFFNDNGVPLPPDPDQLLQAQTYRSESLGDPFLSSFSEFTTPGTDAWKLLVVDDGGSPGGGVFENWHLRGRLVPEPASVALFGLGGLAALRRRRA